VDLADYIGKDVKLRRTGSTYKGLCPFHNEKTPSFMLYPEQNRFHCYGCGKSGDIFTYMQDKDGINFFDAVQMQASRLGIEIPDDNQKNDVVRQQNQRILSVNQQALEFFRHNLKVDPAGRETLAYLTNRGVLPETIDRFKLGYALPSWDSLNKKLLSEKFEQQNIVTAGLARFSSDKKRVYDYFRERVMFPIFNEKNDCVAFGGRVMKKSEPKYLNSPENPVFQKRSILYGIHLAKYVISKNNVAYLVEGYLDVIGLHQKGFASAVAPLGTSLTEAHLRYLKRLTDRLVFLFDGDAAGKKAVLKSARMVLDLGFSCKVVVLPGNRDAFDLSVASPREEIIRIIKDGVPLIDFVINEYSAQFDLSDADGKIRFLHQVYDFLEGYKEIVFCEIAVKKAALISGVDPNTALTDFTNYRKNDNKKNFTKTNSINTFKSPEEKKDVQDSFDYYLLRLVGARWEAWAPLLACMKEGLFLEDVRALYLFNIVKVLADKREKWNAEDFLELVDNSAIAETVRSDISFGRFDHDWERQMTDTVKKIRIRIIRKQRKMLSGEMKKLEIAGEMEQVNQMQKDILFLRRKEEALSK